MTRGAGRTPLAVLRHRDFACYASARLCSVFGWQMMMVALQWRVYEMTGDPLALGLVGLAEFIPFVALVLVGGHLSDHYNRRRIMRIATGLDLLIIAFLWWQIESGADQLWPIYLAIACFGATRAFWSPAWQALLPSIVTRAEFPAAAATGSLFYQIALIAGPATAGLLALTGSDSTLAWCVVLFAGAWLLTLAIRPIEQPLPPASETGTARRFLEGVRFLFANKILLGSMSLDLFAVLLGGAVGLLPVFADLLQVGESGLGLMRMAPGIGAAIVGVVLAIRPIRDHAGLWMFGGVAVFGVATVVFGLSTSLWLSMLALVAAGAGDMISVYVRAIVVQLHTPDAIRGRVSAVNSMFIGASNELGVAESGLAARLFGVVPAVVGGGIATLAITATWMKTFPGLRRLRALV